MDISIAKTKDDIDTCMELRRDVFVKEQGFSEDGEFDAADATSTHIILRDSGVCVGTARYFYSDNLGKIGRICVARSHRGKGLGAALVEFSVEQFKNAPNINQAYLGAQTQARAFYESLGFERQGDDFMDEHVPHIHMFKDL